MNDRSFEDRPQASHAPPRFAFPGMRGKTYEHQVQALAAGYASTAEWAIDDLAARLMELENRVDALDGGDRVMVVDDGDQED